jgi:hypothetical protein
MEQVKYSYSRTVNSGVSTVKPESVNGEKLAQEAAIAASGYAYKIQGNDTVAEISKSVPETAVNGMSRHFTSPSSDNSQNTAILEGIGYSGLVVSTAFPQDGAKYEYQKIDEAASSSANYEYQKNVQTEAAEDTEDTEDTEDIDNTNEAKTNSKGKIFKDYYDFLRNYDEWKKENYEVEDEEISNVYDNLARTVLN